MNPIPYVSEQYEEIKSARQVLLTYCEMVSPEDFVRQGPGFGKGGSIRHLLVHIIHCYEHWIARQTLQLDRNYCVADAIETVDACRMVFLEIDDVMNRFFDEWGNRPTGQFSMMINNKQQAVSGLKLFTHTITHEFHHKGQILTLSRMLGYTPVDTDVMR